MGVCHSPMWGPGTAARTAACQQSPTSYVSVFSSFELYNFAITFIGRPHMHAQVTPSPESSVEAANDEGAANPPVRSEP